MCHNVTFILVTSVLCSFAFVTHNFMQNTFHLLELFSKPVLRLNPYQVFEGDRFRLNCTSDVKVTQRINKSDIRFILFKEDRRISSMATYSDIASSATNGNYSCVAMAKGVNKTSLPLIFKAKGESYVYYPHYCLL